MSRSLKKGPYISVKLDKKVAAIGGIRQEVCLSKAWSRAYYDFSRFRRSYFCSTQW